MCHSIEDKLKNENAKYSRNGISKSKRWCTHKSTRKLASIDWNEKLVDDIDGEDMKMDSNALLSLNVNGFIKVVETVLDGLNRMHNYNIDSAKIVKAIQKKGMHGRMFYFNTELSFGSLLSNAGVKQEYQQLIYSAIKNS